MTLHEAKAISGKEGTVQVEGLPAGDYKFFVCVDGKPISQACSVKIEGNGTAVDGVKGNRPKNNIAYRTDGTVAGRADDHLEHGIYIINGKKVQK